jgi:hypothetical protein
MTGTARMWLRSGRGAVSQSDGAGIPRVRLDSLGMDLGNLAGPPRQQQNKKQSK